MTVPRWVSPLFVVAALYDGILGVLFLLAPGFPFRQFGVTPPNHMGYVQFPAALLLIFALLFASVARDPLRNRGLIPYGILLKVAYCTIAGGYWLTSALPGMWKPFVVADLVMGALFVRAYASCRPGQEKKLA